MNVSYRKKGVPVEIGSKVGRCLCICYHPSRSARPTISRCSFALSRVLFSWVKVLVSDEERNFRKAVELQTFRLLRFRLNYFFQTELFISLTLLSLPEALTGISDLERVPGEWRELPSLSSLPALCLNY